MQNYVLIKVTIGGKELASYSFDNLPISIGRVPECQVVLDNPGISRLHANIECEGEQLKLVDMSSGNGTFVNGKSIESAFITGADTIRIGKFTLNIRTSAIAGKTELPDVSNALSGQEEYEDKTIALSAEDRRKVLMQASALSANKKLTKSKPNYLPWLAVFAVGLGLGYVLSKLVG